MRNTILIVLALGLMSACVQRTNYNLFDGEYFRADARSDRGDRANFTVRVRGIDKSRDGAREAGRYEATQHCLRHFGTSLIDWIDGPEDSDLPVDGDVFVLKGTCVE